MKKIRRRLSNKDSGWHWRTAGWVGLVIAVLIVPFLIFQTFNDDDWNRQVLANFGSFWSPTVAFGNMIVVLSLTLYLRRVERTRSETLERPVVSIRLKDDGSQYLLKNIGKGAAMDIYCYCISRQSLEEKRFAQKRICYSLESGGQFGRPWLNSEVILVEYGDIFNKKYYCMMQDDRFSEFDEKLNPLFKPGAAEVDKYINQFRVYIKWDRSGPTWP